MKKQINIYIEVNEIDKQTQEEFEKYVSICASVNLARDFVNTAPDDLSSSCKPEAVR